MSGIQLCWLRTDLRCQDNRALWQASCQGPVVAVYLATPETWKHHQDAPVKVDFWLRNLALLGQALASRGIPLRILTLEDWACAPRALVELAQALKVAQVWFNDEYGVDEVLRDSAVEQALNAAGIPCQRCTDRVLLAPGSLTTQAGHMFKVYSQFRRKALAALYASPPERCPAPSAQKPLPLASDPVPDRVPGFETVGAGVRELWPAGESAAQERLAGFCDQALETYEERRDFPAEAGTSQLSPYLAAGVLSPRQALHAALQVNSGELDSGNPGAVTWINELLWREFYTHILVCYPRVSRNRTFRPEMEALPWRDDPAALAAWQEGRTGIPIIDAAMRQLLATGWMHNRLRMLVAMFLTKNLLVDWRLGECWFMQHLIDGDLAANNGGWQWSASTGTDAAPYFRIFNPVSQAQKFDPDGVFIRRWVPELAALPNTQVHAPDASARPASYPAPLVDLKQSRQRAIEVFKAMSGA